MKHQIKMIGLDLDGTVLTDKKELTPRTIKAIEQAIRVGVIVLVATGRTQVISGDEVRADVKRRAGDRHRDRKGD